MPPQSQDEDFDLLDVEDYRSGKHQDFSHQTLVMMAMKKVIEYGCQELIPGYYNTEEDNKGRTRIIYKQDTRKAFIESVRTLRMIMICDFDDETTKKLILNNKDSKPDENLMDKLQSRKKFWIDKQKEDWDKLTDGQKRQMTSKGLGVMDDYFNTNLPYFQNYFLEEIEIYREIFEELNILTKRLKFYEAEIAEA